MNNKKNMEYQIPKEVALNHLGEYLKGIASFSKHNTKNAEIELVLCQQVDKKLKK